MPRRSSTDVSISGGVSGGGFPERRLEAVDLCDLARHGMKKFTLKRTGDPSAGVTETR
jgi:hypothetical protein